MIEDLTEQVQELTKQRDDSINRVSGIMGQLKVLTSEVKSLVALLTIDQQREWHAIHRKNCHRLKIDPVTGVSIQELGADDLEREV
jgi:K+/H+ antiporter YhaU regulatory subunit KhtT